MPDASQKWEKLVDKGVENDAFTRSPTLTSASCDCDLWPLHLGCCNTTDIYDNVCPPGIVKICRIFLGILLKGTFVTHFGLMWPTKLNMSWPCPVDHLCLPFCIKISLFDFQNIVFTSSVTDEQTGRNIIPPASLASWWHKNYN